MIRKYSSVALSLLFLINFVNASSSPAIGRDLAAETNKQSSGSQAGLAYEESHRGTRLSAKASASNGLPVVSFSGDSHVPGWATFRAAELVGKAELGIERPAGVVVLNEDHLLYLFGPKNAVFRAIRGANVSHELAAIVISSRTDAAEPVLGIAKSFPPELLSAENRPSLRVEESMRRLVSYSGVVQLETASAQPSWDDIAVEANEDAREHADDQIGPADVSTCSVACGADDGRRYANEEAFSNGSPTGTGNSCLSNTGTYGPRYQCTELVDRTHKRSNWLGDAYVGYWSSLSSGPYQKGLLPLGNNTSFAAPLDNDVLVFSGGTYGHVGILASISGGTVTMHDQNRQCGSQWCSMTYSSSGGVYSIGNTCQNVTSYTLVGWDRRGWDWSGYQNISAYPSSSNFWVVNAAYVSGTMGTSVADIGDYVNINPGPSDPQLVSPTGIGVIAHSASTPWGYNQLKVRLNSLAPNRTCTLYWRRTTDGAFDQSRSVSVNVPNGWTTITLNMSGHPYWNGTIDQIRLDPAESGLSTATDTVSLAYCYFDRGSSNPPPPPCSSSTSGIGVNQTLSGSLATTDCASTVRPGGTFRYDNFTFSATAGTQYTITMNSSSFDTYLYLLSGSAVLAQDDDSNGGTNSRIIITPTSSGTLTIHATSYVAGATGSYSVSVTGSAPPPPNLTPPSNLSASAVSGSQINLTWTDNNSNESGFRVERKTGSGGSWSEIGTVGANAVGASNTGLSADTTYYYRVRAFNSSATSSYSNEAGATTQGGTSCSSSTGPISSGQTLSGNLSTTDCTSTVRTSGFRYDNFTFSATAGTQYTITMNSSAFDTYLYLLSGGTVLTSDDDGNGGTNSRIVYTPSSSGTLTIHCTSYLSGATGAYTVSLSGSSAVYPSIGSISPSTPYRSAYNQTVTIYGSNFQPNATIPITWPGGGGTTLAGAQVQYVSSTQLRMIATLNGVGQWSIRVVNPDGHSSGTFYFNVQ